MKRLWSLAAGLLVLNLLVGCKTTSTPDLAHPSSAAVQQKRALRYDPYPETLGDGASMAGTRPREYTAAPAEVTRSRWNKENQAVYPNSQRWNTDGQK